MKYGDKRIDRYLRQISSRLPLSRARKRPLLDGLATELSEYLSAHPEADCAAIAAEFGSPEAGADNILECAGFGVHAVKPYRKRLLWGLVALVVLILIFLGVKIFLLTQETEAEVTETIVIYDQRSST